jgi:hypothetical protein
VRATQLGTIEPTIDWSQTQLLKASNFIASVARTPAGHDGEISPFDSGDALASKTLNCLRGSSS